MYIVSSIVCSSHKPNCEISEKTQQKTINDIMYKETNKIKLRMETWTISKRQ